MASTYLTRAASDPQSSNTTATYSVWIKRSGLGSDQTFWGGSYYSTDNMFIIKFSSDDKLQVYSKRGASVKASLKTTRLLRDTNAWYHIVVAIDTTQGTASNRIKVYINGVQETSFSTNTQPSQDENLYLDAGAGANYYIGQRGGNAEYFDGSMSHFHYVDGSQLAPTVFGSTDSTTGEWKINTNPSYTVGSKGFFVLKDGNSGTDQSANSNNFTVGGGTLTKTEDNPSNVFATLNPLYTNDSALTYTKGNTVVAYSGSGADSWTTRYAFSSLGMTSGKYYAETKIAAIGTNQMYVMGIISDISANAVNSSFGYLSNAYAYYTADGRIIAGASDLQTGIGTATTNDIVGLAFDADNGTMQLYKNGSAIGSQVTGIPVGDRTWHFGSNFYSTGKIAWNFGNGYFEETAVSSAGTNASGIGIFEYDVPTGYTALSTKGLNE